MDNTVQYQIAITKTGTGATEAVQEFKNLQGAAAAATASANTMSGALRTQKDASQLAGNSLRALNDAAMLAGMSGFPQLGMAVSASTTGMNLARQAAQLTGLSLGALNVIVVGLAAVVGTGMAAWSQYKAELDETKSIADSFGTQDKISGKLKEQSAQLVALGKATDEQSRRWAALLANPTWENIGTVQKEMRPLAGTNADDASRFKTLDLIRQMNMATLEGFDKERAAARENFQERMVQIVAIQQANNEAITGSRPETAAAEAAAIAERDFKLREINAREEAQIVQEFFRQTKEENDYLDELYAGIQRDRAAETAVMIREFEQEQTLAALQSGDDRVAIAQREYTAKVEFYRRLFEEGRISAEQLTDLDNRALINKLQNNQKYEQRYGLHTMTIREMNVQMAESFAGGMSNAFVAFVSGTKSAQQAFKEFAASFLQMVAQMIMQQLILNALKSSGLFGFAGGGTAVAAAGGVFPRYAASGLAGVSEVSTATYFPKFNVVAGEAGREMLTVLAKPRMMSIGGMDAVVGNAGNNRLAITDADALARRGGAGGTIVVEVRGTRDFEARIVNSSVEGAIVRVQNDMATDSQLARATKNLVT